MLINDCDWRDAHMVLRNVARDCNTVIHDVLPNIVFDCSIIEEYLVSVPARVFMLT